jgi:hypothetical protein
MLLFKDIMENVLIGLENVFIWFKIFKDSLGITFGGNVCSLGEFCQVVNLFSKMKIMKIIFALIVKFKTN